MKKTLVDALYGNHKVYGSKILYESPEKITTEIQLEKETALITEYKSRSFTVIYYHDSMCHDIVKNERINQHLICAVGYVGYSDTDNKKYALQHIWEQSTSNELREIADLIDKLPNIGESNGSLS